MAPLMWAQHEWWSPSQSPGFVIKTCGWELFSEVMKGDANNSEVMKGDANERCQASLLPALPLA